MPFVLNLSRFHFRSVGDTAFAEVGENGIIDSFTVFVVVFFTIMCTLVMMKCVGEGHFYVGCFFVAVFGVAFGFLQALADLTDTVACSLSPLASSSP